MTYNHRHTRDQEPPPPAHVYAALWMERPDSYAVERVRRAYERSLVDEREGAGYVYSFRDRRDLDDSTLMKIGETSRTPEQRLNEWSQALGDDSASALALVFAYRTRRRRLVERVVHALFAHRRDHLRVNRQSERALGEYFSLASLTLTKTFVDAVVQHVDWFDAEVRRGL